MGKEVGSAQVAVFPTFHGFRGKINTEVSASGRDAGKAFSNTFKTASATTAPDLSKLKAEVRSATQVLSKARLDQADAAGKVRVAEARLAEAVEKTGKDSARSVAAQEQLASAQRKLETASDKTTGASQRLATAQTNLARETAQAGQAGSRGAVQYARGWEGLKQRLSATLRGAVRDAGNDAETEARKAGRGSGNALLGGLKGLGGTLIAGLGVGMVVDGFNQITTKASDSTETLNKAQTVFGKQFSGVQTWAQSANTALGLTQQQAIGFASSFGDMFSQIGFGSKQAAGMSKSVVQMSADLGSFNNLPTAEVADMMGAAFRGEYDSLQRLIPNINDARVKSEALAMTGKENASQLTAQEKAAAVLAIVNKDGARAMGDFARTSEDAANKQKIVEARSQELATKFGDLLLPVREFVLDGLGQLITVGEQVLPWFSKAGQAFSGLAGSTGGLQSAFAPLAAWFQSSVMPLLEQVRTVVIERVQAIIAVFGSFATGMQQRMAPAMPVIQQIFGTIGQIITGALGLITTLISTGTSAMTGFWAQWGGTIMDVTATVWNALLGVIQPVLNTIQAVIATVTAAVKGDWSGVWNGILGILRGVWDTIVAVIRGALSIIGSIMSVVWNAIVSTVKGAWDRVTGAVSTGVSTAVNFIKGLPGKAISALGNLASKLVSAGRDLIGGFIQGVKDAAGRLISSVTNAVWNAVDAAKRLLRISSPSRVFMEIADYSIQGAEIGFDRGAPRLASSAAAAMGAAVNAARSAPQIGGSSIAGAAGGTDLVAVLAAAFARAIAGTRVQADFGNTRALASQVAGEIVFAAGGPR